MCGGWYLNGQHLYIGLTRLAFPFFGGLLLYRLQKQIRVKNAFLLTSLLLIVLFSVPRIGDAQTVWLNGIFEIAMIFAVFPVVVLMGAGGKIRGKFANWLCRALGDISYPVYLINYPVCYLLKAWVSRTRETDPSFGVGDAVVESLAVFVFIILLSYAVAKWYDIPVRKWLKKKL
jgi:peptidoglycan/LPS O-acetylase OafA/YrhL